MWSPSVHPTLKSMLLSKKKRNLRTRCVHRIPRVGKMSSSIQLWRQPSFKPFKMDRSCNNGKAAPWDRNRDGSILPLTGSPKSPDLGRFDVSSWFKLIKNPSIDDMKEGDRYYSVSSLDVVSYLFCFLLPSIGECESLNLAKRISKRID